MQMNVKSIFFVATLLILLLGITVVSASNVTDNTYSQDTISTTDTISTADVDTAQEIVKNTNNIENMTKTSKNNMEEKTINKTEKQTKTTTKTVEVNNYDELTATINGVDSDSENDEFIINLNEGTYQLPSKASTKVTVTSNKNITVNANNQNLISVKTSHALMTITTGNLTFNQAVINHTITNNGGNLILNNSIINYKIRNINNANLIINNCTLNCTLENTGITIIDDQTTLGPNFNITENTNIDNIITNNSYFKPEPEEIPNLTNENITQDITIPQTGNITFTDCNITAKITNQGNITLINCSLSNNNMTTTSSKTDGFLLENKGNATLVDCRVENNTFNITTTSNDYPSGVIVNQKNAILLLNNTRFNNNNNTGNEENYLIYNLGVITYFNNCSFTNNNMKSYVTQGYGAYQNYVSPDEFDLNVSDLWYENNTETFSASHIRLIINSKFINNNRIDNEYYASNGGALTGSNLNVVNTIFVNNGITLTDATAVSGGSGGAISGKNLTVFNCTFDSNYAINPSTWLSLQGGGAIYTSGTSTITQSTFKNNYVISPEGVVQSEEWGGKRTPGMGGAIINQNGNITITDNQFVNNSASINGSAIYLYGGNNLIAITNNTFSNNKEATETIYIKDYNTTTTNIQDNTYTNTSIGFKTLTLNGPNKAYTGDQITITLDIELEHPEFYDTDILEQTNYSWYINGETSTDKETTKTLTVETQNIIIYTQPTIANTRTKILSITPTILNDIIITPENITPYIFEGEVITNPNTKLIFQGEFNNIGEIYNNKNEIYFDGTNATFTNTSFKIEAHNNTIQNMNINNTDTSEYMITIIGNDNIIINNTLTQTNNNGKTAAIKNNGNNNKITENTIKVSGPALSITYEGGSNTANTQAILSLGGQDNQITYNNITVDNSTDSEQAQFSTIEAITAPSGTNTNISYNTIHSTGARFNYGINTLDNVENNTITYNNITVTGYRYTDGIQVGNGANNNYIAYNNINLTCLNTTPVDEAAISYGVIVTSQGGQTSDNNTIQENNININGAVNYGMEIYTATNTNINNNNITLTGIKSMAIGYAHSPNSTITDNIITITDDTTQPLNGVTEEIQPLSIGIRVQQDSNNIQITDNTITTNDKAKTDKTIDTDSQNTTIKNNKLTSSTGYGADTIQTTQTDTIIENNIINTNITTDDITTLTNTPTTLTATVTTETGANVNGGTVTFTDTEGNTIATATVNNGTATATVTFKEATTTTITATYTPSSTGLTTSTTTAQLDVQEPVTNLTIEYDTLIAGQNVTLTAKLTDQLGNNINGGKVVFKINGKTIKDENGKVIYAKVVNGTATVTYNIPSTYADKNITIEAVYSGTNKYNSARTQTNTTIQKTTPTFTTKDVTATIGETITLKATITDAGKVINTGKVVFKINGKTVKDANGKVIYAKITNGIATVNYTIPNTYKAKSYTLTATLISNEYDKLTDTKTLTITA